MNDLKRLSSTYVGTTRLPLKVTHDFPARVFFGTTLGWKLSPALGLNISYEFHSTGGRLHYQDYSGRAVLDQILKLNQIGVSLRFMAYRSMKNSFYFSTGVSRNFTSLQLKEELQIGAIVKSEVEQLSSSAWGLRPAIFFERRMGNLIAQVGFGFDVLLRNDLKVDGNDLTLQHSPGNDASAQWDGLRASFGIGFSLGK